MGQSNSILLQLERDTYLPGETVRGVAHVLLVEQLECDGIKLKAIGEMRTRWKETRSAGQFSYVLPYYGKESLMNGEQMFAEKGKIEPGMYSYPFEVILPQILPASLDWDQKKSGFVNKRRIGQRIAFWGRATVAYFVQAVGMRTGTLSRDIKSEPLAFTVLSRNTVTPSGPLTVSDTQESVVCFSFKEGSLSGSLTISADAAESGSTLAYSAELKNNSKDAIKAVEVSFKQRVTLQGRIKRAISAGSTLQVFYREYNKEQVPVSEGKLKPGGWAQELKGGLGPLPQELLHTLSYPLVKVENFVELQAKMGPLTKNFRLEAPVIIFSAAPAALPPPSASSPHPYYPTHGKETDPETAPLLSYIYPKLDAPLHWSPRIFKQASLKVSPGSAGTSADNNEEAEEYFCKNGW